MTIKSLKNTNGKIFTSLKNKASLPFKSEVERLIMQMFEFDLDVDSYTQFEFRIVNLDNLFDIEPCPGFITKNGDTQHFVVISNYLAKDKLLLTEAKRILEKAENQSISLTIYSDQDIENNILIKNLDFLYTYALFPRAKEDFQSIQNYLDFVEETTIKKLKFIVDNDDAVYQLLFHHGLRADLKSELLTEDTLINASPVINSVIRNLTN